MNESRWEAEEEVSEGEIKLDRAIACFCGFVINLATQRRK